MPVATPSQTKLRRTAPPVAGTGAHAAARNSKKVNPPLHAPTSLGGKPPVAPPHTDAEKERQMYIDFKNDGGRCELTSLYKSRRSEYEEKHEFIALTPIDIPATSPKGTTALLGTVLAQMQKCGRAEAILTVGGGEFYRVGQMARAHQERYKGIFVMCAPMFRSPPPPPTPICTACDDFEAKCPNHQHLTNHSLCGGLL